MRRWIHRIEVMVDGIVPHLLIILALLLLGQMFIPEELMAYHTAIEMYDWFVIAVFAIDLGFKYQRIRNIPKFLQRYWVDILATIPLFVVLRMLEEFSTLGRLFRFQEELRQPQVLVHEGLVIERQTARIVADASRLGEMTRFQRWGRLLERIPRFLKVLAFHEKPSGRCHPGESR